MNNDLEYLRKENRVGKFYLKQDALYDSHVRKALGQCIIFRAEAMHFNNTVKYYAYCPNFAKAIPGAKLIAYDLYMRPDGKVCWTDRDPSRFLSNSECFEGYTL